MNEKVKQLLIFLVMTILICMVLNNETKKKAYFVERNIKDVAQLESNYEQLLQLSNLKKRYDMAYSELPRLSINFSDYVLNVANTAGINVTKIVPGAKNTDSNITAERISLSVTATYKNLITFLQRLEQDTNNIILVEKLVIVGVANKKGGANEYNISLDLVRYGRGNAQ